MTFHTVPHFLSTSIAIQDNTLKSDVICTAVPHPSSSSANALEDVIGQSQQDMWPQITTRPKLCRTYSFIMEPDAYKECFSNPNSELDSSDGLPEFAIQQVVIDDDDDELTFTFSSYDSNSISPWLMSLSVPDIIVSPVETVFPELCLPDQDVSYLMPPTKSFINPAYHTVDTTWVDPTLPIPVFSPSKFRRWIKKTSDERFVVTSVVSALQKHMIKYIAIVASSFAYSFRERWDLIEFSSTIDKPFRYIDAAEPVLNAIELSSDTIIVHSSTCPWAAPHITITLPDSPSSIDENRLTIQDCATLFAYDHKRISKIKYINEPSDFAKYFKKSWGKCQQQQAPIYVDVTGTVNEDEDSDYDYLYNTPPDSPLVFGPCAPVCDIGDEDEANRLFWEEFGDDIGLCEPMPMSESLLAELMRAPDSSFCGESFSQTRPSCRLFDDDDDDEEEEEEDADVISPLDGWYQKATLRLGLGVEI